MATLAVVGGATDSAAAVGITLDINKDCESNFTTSDAAVSFGRKDAVVWTIVSACEKTQKVRIYTKDDGNPFAHCEGIPTAANIDSEFGGVTKFNPKYILCTINWGVLIGSEKCEPGKNCPTFEFGHSIDQDKAVTGAREVSDRPAPEKAGHAQDLDPKTCCARGLRCCRAPELKLEVDP